jgi:hypothetical protein
VREQRRKSFCDWSDERPFAPASGAHDRSCSKHERDRSSVPEGGIEAGRAEEITRSVIAVLRNVVRPEAQDIAAVLPGELRELWESEPAT